MIKVEGEEKRIGGPVRIAEWGWIQTIMVLNGGADKNDGPWGIEGNSIFSCLSCRASPKAIFFTLDYEVGNDKKMN